MDFWFCPDCIKFNCYSNIYSLTSKNLFLI
jgi:hypothetical protein